jgi:hypothetical protein
MIPHGTCTHCPIRTRRLAPELHRLTHAAWPACRAHCPIRTSRPAPELYHLTYAAWPARRTHRPMHTRRLASRPSHASQTRSTLCAR